MKKIFTLIALAVLSFGGSVAQEVVTSTAVRYIKTSNGQVVAIPEKYILSEMLENGVCTLSLQGDRTFSYSIANATVSDSYDVTGAKLLSFGFTNADNDQVYADVEATVTEVGDTVFVEANVPVIGKRLRPSFTLSEGSTLWLNGVQQVSGQSSVRYTEPAVYTLVQPKHWMYEVETVVYEEPEDEESGNDETETGDGWKRTKIDISEITTTNAPSNNNSGNYDQELDNIWDDSDETYFHSTWGNGTYTKLNWVEGGYYGDGVTEWPYIDIVFNEPLENFCLSYTTSNEPNRFPQGWRITALNTTTWEFDEIAVLTEENSLLPQANLTKFTTPVYSLGEEYMLIRIELTKASYKNYMVIGDLSLYSCVEEKEGEEEVEPVEPEQPAESQLVGSFKPFGRPCKVNVNYLTDSATGDYKIPTIYITFGDGVTWDDTQWIGQTLPDGTNTKEEWIKDCTFRLDGAGVWPDIDTVEGCEVRGRGNSSWSWSSMSKNPYRIKFPKKQKQAPFNLTKDRQWVFIANKQNGSMTTNAIAQKIAAMVDGEALCHMIPVDLYVNGHYRGSYCFTEKIGIADNSVAIDETTGCLLELDDYYDEDYRFRDDTYNLPVNVKDPDFTEDDEERVITYNNVQSSFNAMTAELATGGNNIANYVDMESWAKFWLVNDLVRNVETYHPKSCYIFNEDPAGGGLWKFGPAWDFDWAFGYEESSRYFTTGAEEDIYSSRNGKAGYQFFTALRNTNAGKRAYYKEWADFVLEGRLQELQEYIADYTEFAKLSIAHNNDANVTEKNRTDYAALVQTSQNWMKSRADYIFKNMDKFSIESSFIVPEDYGKPLEALVINDALHEDFAPVASKYASMVYARGIAEGAYGTIVLPFVPDATSLEHYAFYELTECGDDYIRFEEVAEPVANTPYIYTLREGKECIAITGGETVVSDAVKNQVVDGWETVGSFVNNTIDTSAGNYYAFSSARSEINRVTEALTVLPYRAYFKAAVASKASMSVYIGGTTSVIKISADKIDGLNNGCVYDVYGRRVIVPVKGEIYVVNGKKVIF